MEDRTQLCEDKENSSRRETNVNRDTNMGINNHCNQISEKQKCFPQVNRRLLVNKSFYVFFYAAIGALLPYLPIYFKQLNLSPHQNGVLIGIRPLIQFAVTPLWGACADRFCRNKTILLFAVFGWLISNYSLSFAPVLDEGDRCKFFASVKKRHLNGADKNSDLSFERTQQTVKEWTKQDKIPWYDHEIEFPSIVDPKKMYGSCHRKIRKMEIVSYMNETFYKPKLDEKFPWSLDLMSDELEETDKEETVKQVYIKNSSPVFLYLLMITVMGTVISAPAHVMSDTATLQSLGAETEKYGKQRLWGSLGWGVGGFSIGVLVSRNYKVDCNNELFVDYSLSFYSFAVFMIVAFICATRFRYKEKGMSDDCGGFQQIVDGLKVLKDLQYSFVMFIAFFCGSSTGFIETFLFWYLEELGGNQLLFSVVNGMNCIAEVVVFFFTDRLITRLGHVNVIYLALACYFIRFMYFYFVSSMNPWYVIPAELLQGITTAAFWTACVSYVGLHPGASHTLQGILNGVYMGLGFASGGIIGGFIVCKWGIPTAFLVYAVLSLIILIVFYSLNKYREMNTIPSR